MADDSDSSSTCSRSSGRMVDDDLTTEQAPDYLGSTTPDRGSQDATLFPPTNQSDIDHGTINARAYQLEMLWESQMRNIILAMDTGSGKTQVYDARPARSSTSTDSYSAVLRIRAELEEGVPNKMVWFMAPTVVLCAQQHSVLQSQMPAVQTRLLRGSDNVDSWSNQETWDAVLLNIRIVVSTPQILYDALSHGFVQMNSLSLLVFDEAHHSAGKSAPRRIMMDFYHTRKQAGLPIPHILGLTASPIMRSKIEGLEALEQTLDAVCVTPRLHREDLLIYVKRPTLSYARYEPAPVGNEPHCMSSLREAYRNIDITKDPFVLHLRAVGTDRARRDLIKVLENHDTSSHQQMKSFFDQSLRVWRDLGPWAAEYYVWKVVTDVLATSEARNPCMNDWRDQEKQYLAEIFRQVQVSEPPVSLLTTSSTSQKVAVLMHNLASDESDDTVAVVFVKERSTAAMLAQVIESHPTTRGKYPSIGVVVGTSNHLAKKKNVWDLSRSAYEAEPLLQFRSGALNLLIATNVLEEGIDVPACNLVICFDEPENLKSFIQRRGRARKKDSRLLVLLPSTNPVPRGWEIMEAKMKEHYEDQKRDIQRIEEIDASEAAESEQYVVENTNARLDFENAKAHLDHFCSVLSPGEFIDTRPDYMPRVVDNENPPSLRVTVLLPVYVPDAVRRAESRRAWKSERNASKDAAFQAYLGLYKAGLINDNMLPYTREDIVPATERHKSVLEVNGLVNVWLGIARAWRDSSEFWSIAVCLKDSAGSIRGTYLMRTPVRLPTLHAVPVYIDQAGPWLLEFRQQNGVQHYQARDHTAVLLALHFSHRWPADSRQQVVSFSSMDVDLDIGQIGARHLIAADVVHRELPYLIRDMSGCPYIYHHSIDSKPSVELVKQPFRNFGDTPGFLDAPSDVPYLALRKWSRRADFLHRQSASGTTQEPTSTKPYTRVYPATWAKVDSIPLDHAYFGALIPSILHHIEVRLVAEQLSSSLLRDLNFSDPFLVLTAISASGASEASSYERLELLGDSIFKLCTTVNVAALHPNWPVGYLSCKKDNLVSNSRLCRAALNTGLDKFILTKSFTGRKWRPVYVDDLLEHGADGSGPRKMSSKTLADVVEALIGAAYVDGDLPKALACISIFLKELDWKPLDACQLTLNELAVSDVTLPPMLAPLEELIGYTFKKKSLLVEAVTHASFTAGHASSCFERLEFLGDAILDDIVVSYLFPLNLSQDRMHLLKTASVNGDLLGFFALESHVEEDEVLIDTDSSPSERDSKLRGDTKDQNEVLSFKRVRRKLPLWTFMRHSSQAIVLEQSRAAESHANLRESILHALEHGSNYPWTLLAHLRAKKFFSDLVEALLGAVWVDSGDIDACARVAERIGILPVLARLTRDDVHVLHPKQELGQLAGHRTVEYLVTAPEIAAGRRSVGITYACKVMVAGRCIVEVDDGIAQDEVETKAAHIAVRILKDEQAEARAAGES